MPDATGMTPVILNENVMQKSICVRLCPAIQGNMASHAIHPIKICIGAYYPFGENRGSGVYHQRCKGSPVLEKATIPAIMGAGEYFRARLCDDPKTEGARAWLPRVVTPVLLFSAD